MEEEDSEKGTNRWVGGSFFLLLLLLLAWACCRCSVVCLFVCLFTCLFRPDFSYSPRERKQCVCCCKMKEDRLMDASGPGVGAQRRPGAATNATRTKFDVKLYCARRIHTVRVNRPCIAGTLLTRATGQQPTANESPLLPYF